MLTTDIEVIGVVQGIGFRAEIVKIALALGLKGYVENLDNGNVHIVLQGDESLISAFVEHIKSLPSPIIIQTLHIKKMADIASLQGFTIRK